MIKPPFADYNRAELERLVQEAFEEIEFKADGHGYPMAEQPFQTLVAAEYYLRKTEPKS